MVSYSLKFPFWFFYISVFHVVFVFLKSSIAFTLHLVYKHQQKSCVVVCNPSNGNWRQKDQEFRGILISKASLRPAWTTWDGLQIKKEREKKSKLNPES